VGGEREGLLVLLALVLSAGGNDGRDSEEQQADRAT
jgi:hypothetical protein